MWYILGPKLLRKVSSSDGAKIRFKFAILCLSGHETASHHYQASIDFNIANIHPTVKMYFFVSTGNREDIE